MTWKHRTQLPWLHCSARRSQLVMSAFSRRPRPGGREAVYQKLDKKGHIIQSQRIPNLLYSHHVETRNAVPARLHWDTVRNIFGRSLFERMWMDCVMRASEKKKFFDASWAPVKSNKDNFLLQFPYGKLVSGSSEFSKLGKYLCESLCPHSMHVLPKDPIAKNTR